MIKIRFRKAWYDLWANKPRTLLVVLAITIGVFAIGMTTGAQTILSEDLFTQFNATNPGHAVFILEEPFSDDLVESIQRMDTVSDAEGFRYANVRLQVGLDRWQNTRLDAYEDFDDIRINRVVPEAGDWPPPKQTLLIERSSLGLANADLGDVVIIETPNGKRHELQLVGLTHDMHKQPTPFTGLVYGYISFDTLEQLGFTRTFNQLNISTNNQEYEQIKQTARDVETKIKKIDYHVHSAFVPAPGEHPADQIMQPILGILGLLGVFLLVLSSFLVINTISGILTKQIRQIGVMKTIGANRWQIVAPYLGTVFVYCVLALFVAVPLGALAAYGFTLMLANLINFDLAGFRLVPRAVVLQIIAGLFIPMAGSLWPIISGTRLTVREAISSQGEMSFGQSRIDQWLERIQGISSQILFSLRNTFRRKVRLAITLLTLTLAGALFVAVFSVRASLLLTLDEFAAYWNHDVQLRFDDSYHTERVSREVLQIPGVERVENWALSAGSRVRPDGEKSPNFTILAPPADSTMLQASLVKGRWLLPDDTNAIVIDTDILDNEPDIDLGDIITVNIIGEEAEWEVVGVAKPALSGSILRFGTAYVNYPYYTRVAGLPRRVDSTQVVLDQHDRDSQIRAATALENRFRSQGFNVRSVRTTTSIQDTMIFQFNILVIFLSTMTILLAVVGALGLMGTMSLNVLERVREVGIMRATGASEWIVLQSLLVEGVFIGAMSWPGAVLLAWPISLIISNSLGLQFVGSPLNYTFSVGGAGFWLIVVLVLAILASFLPAWNATRITVREVLMYDA
jgi:putative ABC transport system permease protein